MNKLKMIVSIVFSVVVIQMISIPTIINTQAAEQTINEKEFVIKDGVLERYAGEGGDVVVPDGVVSIGKRAFEEDFSIEDSQCITSITLSDTVISIEKEAFYGCRMLKSVKMSDSVTNIGSSAFGDCENLIEISSLDGVSSIGDYAFAGTPWLAKKCEENPIVIINGNLIDGRGCKGDVTIPDTVTTIVGYAFSFNKEIISVSIPDSVESIGDVAFADCRNLVTVKMTDSVKSIGEEVFENCTSLKNIRLSNSIKVIKSWTFKNCKKLASITIPYPVTKIEDTAFQSCKSLKYVTISNKVKSVEYYGNKAFSDCPNLIFYGQDKSYIQTYAKKNKIPFKKLALAMTKKTLKTGEAYSLKMNSRALCSWKSGNKSVATVDANGKITAKKKGKATITATLYGKSYQCVVTVK
ncbi:leucine-rich repeat protein [Anaerocolumna sp. MB42-C2]|uniref:leucine-rich repeat protein n=1 Tax=Anaerocolumna sp. MB42-C2 TaxID=3070997 RepID=UPI0027E16248|nr:leucine-rich repeat protein [Anaerocolumna sp. MB42-C2]WMJ86369.1 leucine-rich repeat protein [Anaerocolumna sp. MB42-C2]